MLNKLKDFVSANKLAKYFAWVVLVLVVFASLNSIWDILAKWGWASPVFKDPRTITISAEGKVTVTPDTARISASVVTDGPTADEVQKRNTESMNRVIDYVKGLGVEAADVKTTYYNLYPRYDYINGRQIPAGYSLSQTLEIKVRNLAKVGEVLSGVVSRGANQVSNVEYFVDDPDNFKAEARSKAFDKAQAKAKELAKLAGVHLGKVVTFSESYNGGVIPMYEKAYSSGIGMGGGGMPDTQPGSQEITVNVNVVFEVR